MAELMDLASIGSHQKSFATSDFKDHGFMGETIEVVKEKAWSLRSVWNRVAEAFCRAGASPTILGYSSVPLHEDDYVKEHDEGALALAKVDENEIPKKCPGLLIRSLSHSSEPEVENLVHTDEEYEEDVNHGFAELATKDLVEKKSLTRAAS